MGYPFAYEGGTVTAVDSINNLVTIGDRVYDVSPGTPNVSVNEQVERFQILSSGVQIRDWYSHPSEIESIIAGLGIGETIEKRLALNLDSQYTFPHSPELLKAFKRNSIPAGVRLV